MGSLPSKRRRTSLPSSGTNHQLHSDNNKNVVVALYNFPSGGQSETIITIGERLRVLSEDGGWWKVVSVSTGKECYIPSNYAAKVYHRWLYEGISREKAEELLLLPCNQGGSFIVRESETQKGTYCLSIRRANNSGWDCIKHYRINRLENGWFYISPRLTFASLEDMVDYYSETGEGLCCTLKNPCFIQGVNPMPIQNYSEPIIVKKPALNWNEVDSSILLNEDGDLNEDSQVSVGLREAINSYMYMTEDVDLKGISEKKNKWKAF
ncbi:src-like-adapter 2 [Protopterus annectens]|uniref:src-like-adapter 2 n=1 Tax=Protopterus annectens TaxID=7888 RepID=UPI001CF9AF04|nr:src-like-adapter 2 [Protopterus annectens]